MQFEEYVEARGQALLNLASVLTGDPHRAEDLVQTVLVDVLRHWRRVAAARDIDAYVRRMLVNAQLDWQRRRSSSEVPTDVLPDVSGSAPDVAEVASQRDQLRELLSSLTPRARTTLVLRYYLGLDDRAIAEALGVGQSTVRSTVSRALAALREGASTEMTEEI